VTVVDPSTPPSAEPSNLEGAPAAPSELDHGSHDDQDNDKDEEEQLGLRSLGRVLSDIVNSAVTASTEPAADAAALATIAAAATAEPAEPVTPPPRASTPTPLAWPLATVPALSLSTLSFPVEVADGRRLTIAWQSGADANTVAAAFARTHGLPAEDFQDIVSFVQTAEALVKQQKQVCACVCGGVGVCVPECVCSNQFI